MPTYDLHQALCFFASVILAQIKKFPCVLVFIIKNKNMEETLVKTIPGRRRPNFSYSTWNEVQEAIERGIAEHVVEFRDMSQYYRMDDLLNQYSSFSDEEKRRFKVAKTRKGFSTWYWAVLMKTNENV